jgi:uncharacterized protein (TIGR02246 family)
MIKKIALLFLCMVGLAAPLSATATDEAAKANHGPVADRLAIRELVESYNSAVIEINPQKWISHWAKDGVWNLGGGDIEGKDAILEHWLSAMAPYKYAAMFSQPVFIQVDGDEAQAQWHTNERLQLPTGDQMLVIGRYNDRYKRLKEGWKIKSRHYSVVFTTGRPAS